MNIITDQTKKSILHLFSMVLMLPLSGWAGPVLITPADLNETLADENLVILHVGPQADFASDHIPGARYISLRDLLVDIPDGLRHELPPPAQVDSGLQSVGVKHDSQVVLYYTDESGIFFASRILLTLTASGLNTKLMDGGLSAWKEGGFPTTDQITDPETGDFHSVQQADIIVDSKWVQSHLNNTNVRIVDARPEDEYSGKNIDLHFKRKGHIANAVNLPYYSVTMESAPLKFKNIDKLSRDFISRGIKPGDTLVVYCGTGIWASQVYVAARQLGYETLFYDGSFQDWSSQEELPIVAQRRRWKLW